MLPSRPPPPPHPEPTLQQQHQQAQRFDSGSLPSHWPPERWWCHTQTHSATVRVCDAIFLTTLTAQLNSAKISWIHTHFTRLPATITDNPVCVVQLPGPLTTLRFPFFMASPLLFGLFVGVSVPWCALVDSGVESKWPGPTWAGTSHAPVDHDISDDQSRGCSSMVALLQLPVSWFGDSQVVCVEDFRLPGLWSSLSFYKATVSEV